MLGELSRLELQKLELLQKKTEFHPDVVLVTEQIERTKIELTKYNQNTLTAYQITLSVFLLYEYFGIILCFNFYFNLMKKKIYDATKITFSI